MGVAGSNTGVLLWFAVSSAMTLKKLVIWLAKGKGSCSQESYVRNPVEIQYLENQVTGIIS